MLTADQIKVKLIDYFIDQENLDLLASEVSFYQGYRKADFVQMSENNVTAFEIKSDRDNLLKLKEQMEDYNHTFNFCYLVTTEKHLKKSRELIGAKVGIILIKDRSVIIIRKPLENKRLSKHSLVLSLNCNDLMKLDIGNYGSLQNKRKKVIEKTNLNILKNYFYQTLLKKYQNKYHDFLLDRGEKTTLTDLYYLQSYN